MEINNPITSLAQLTTKDHDLLDGLADDDHSQYLNTARHDLTARHPLAVLDTLVCSEAEADAKITTHTALPNAHHNQSHGNGDHTDTSQSLFSFPVVLSGGATLGSYLDYPRASLADGVDSGVDFAFVLPEDFVGVSGIELLWSSLGHPGNAYLDATLGLTAPYDTLGTLTETTGSAAYANGAADDLNPSVLGFGAILAQFAAGQLVGLHITRHGGDASDTLNDSMAIYGARIIYTRNH